MKQLFTTAVLLFSATAFAQVGINNTSPKATLDITAKTTDGSKPEGLIIPQVAGNQIRTATASGIYGASQKGLIVYASSADTAPAGATVNITAPGYYYFDGSVWQRIAVGGSSLNTTLNSGNIYVGNASNVATSVAPTGDVTISNTGVTSIGSGKVTSTQIADGTVANADLASATGGIYKGNGSLAGNTTVTQGTNTLAFTSTASTGTSHFTIDGTTLNVDAANDRVGIGTSSPSVKLEINSATAGAIKIVDGTQAADKVLMSDANGVGTWREPASIRATVLGSFPSTTANVSSDGGSSPKYSQIYIDLPQGKWIVNAGLTLTNNGSTSAYWMHATLSTSNSTNQQNGFSFLGPAGSSTSYAMTVPPSTSATYSFLSGSSVINVTATSVRIYLLLENKATNYWSFTTNAWENYLYALPVN